MNKNTCCYSVFIFKNIYILKTKNLIPKQKRCTKKKQNKVETLL